MQKHPCLGLPSFSFSEAGTGALMGSSGGGGGSRRGRTRQSTRGQFPRCTESGRGTLTWAGSVIWFWWREPSRGKCITRQAPGLADGLTLSLLPHVRRVPRKHSRRPEATPRTEAGHRAQVRTTPCVNSHIWFGVRLKPSSHARRAPLETREQERWL